MGVGISEMELSRKMRVGINTAGIMGVGINNLYRIFSLVSRRQLMNITYDIDSDIE